MSWIAAYNLAAWTQPRGHMNAAGELAERAFELGQQAGEPDALLIYGAQLANVRIYEGRGDEVVEMLQQSVAAYPQLPGWRAGLAHVYCLLGRLPEAAAIVETAATDGFEHVTRDQSRTTALALYADAAAQANVPDAAALLYELIEPWRDQIVWNGAVGYGHAQMWLGLLAATLGWRERTDEHLAFAADFQEANGLLLWAAYAHLGWGEALASRGEYERSQEEGARALELARVHGYGAFEDRAAAIVAGASSPRS